ncbi:MAG: glycoside hydrolase family 38 N-terminal domain-containing protein, partial [Candidatus Aminicenantales bacterium]
MNDLAFLFAVHNHQPVGNFPEIFKAAFNDCYRPLLEALAGHPGFRFALHFSGPLWEYMEKTERGCWDLVHELSVRGQVELLGGGFYEPVLSIIPEEDRLGQIRMMNDFLAENFGQRPRGLWLTERVWEPDLPRTLAAAGIEFTLLDEEHFHYAGVRD